MTSACNNPGFAFVVNSLLNSNKNVRLLSKAKKEDELKVLSQTPDQPVPELVGEDGNIVQQSEQASPGQHDQKRRKVKLSKINRHQIESIARTKPKLEERERERKLTLIATKGVVQLFNVVKEQQKQIKHKLNQVGSSDNKRTKVFSEFNEENLFKKVNEKNSKVCSNFL